MRGVTATGRSLAPGMGSFFESGGVQLILLFFFVYFFFFFSVGKMPINGAGIIGWLITFILIVQHYSEYW